MIMSYYSVASLSKTLGLGQSRESKQKETTCAVPVDLKYQMKGSPLLGFDRRNFLFFHRIPIKRDDSTMSAAKW